jgi:hypothetical protein
VLPLKILMSDQDYDDLPAIPALQLLAAIDAEQNALLEQLDALNARLEQVLQTCTVQSSQTILDSMTKRAA